MERILISPDASEFGICPRGRAGVRLLETPKWFRGFKKAVLADFDSRLALQD